MSAFTSDSLCVICHTKDANAAVVPVPARAPRGTAWLWVSPAAAAALATRDLGVILRTYRAVNQVSQRQLAEELGYDPAYISLLERALGHILPEERLASATYWTGKALRTAGHLGEHLLLAHVLRMHGNELRKAGYLKAGAGRLTQAMTMSHSQTERRETLALFARAAGELGDPGLFDNAIQDATQILGRSDEYTMLFNPFALREIHLRGLLATGRADAAAALARTATPGHTPTAPQWEIIERVTSADVLARTGQSEHAATALKEAVTSAEHRHLPHQIQRVIRVSTRSEVPAVQAIHVIARQALAHIQAGSTPAVPAWRALAHDR